MRRAPGQGLWHRWQMRCNPFGEPPRSELPGLVVGDLDAIFAWWQGEPRRAVQWIGPCGHGKTAHLAGLRARAPGIATVYLPEDGPRPELPEASELLVDEAQRLPRLDRPETKRFRC